MIQRNKKQQYYYDVGYIDGVNGCPMAPDGVPEKYVSDWIAGFLHGRRESDKEIENVP